MLKGVLAKMGHGLLIGIGFAVAMSGLLYGYTKWQMKEFEESTGMSAMFKEYTPEVGLSIKEHRPQRAQANSAFLGTIVNNGQDTWESVEVLAELFDKEGTFVDKCSSYMDGSISPGQTRNFKVSCSGCRDDSQPMVYDRYTIAIVDASFSRPEEARSN